MNDTALRPTTKNARHQCIIELVSTREVKSQGELAHLLAERPRTLTASSSTRSRDRVAWVTWSPLSASRWASSPWAVSYTHLTLPTKA